MAWNYELFIDGAWTSEGASGSTEVLDPATEAVIGSVPEASTKTAVRAIEAARRAFDEGPWPFMKPGERAAKLVAMAEILERRAGDLRELIIAETGSTGFLTDAVQGAGSIGMLRSNGAWSNTPSLGSRGACRTPVPPCWAATRSCASRSAWWRRSPRSTSPSC